MDTSTPTIYDIERAQIQSGTEIEPPVISIPSFYGPNEKYVPYCDPAYENLHIAIRAVVNLFVTDKPGRSIHVTKFWSGVNIDALFARILVTDGEEITYKKVLQIDKMDFHIDRRAANAKVINDLTAELSAADL